jgi:hypothetical protein
VIGIFFFWLNTFVRIVGCEVGRNFGLERVGAIMSFADSIVIRDSNIVHNRASGDYGGVLIEGANNILIQNSSFMDNFAEGLLADYFLEVDLIGSGGLAISSSSNVLIEHCLFGNNIAYHFGGGLFVTYTDNVVMRNCSLVNNTAKNGAGMNLYRSRSVVLSSLWVEGNAAGSNGGGVFAEIVENIEVLGSKMVSNVASNGFGSAIFVFQCSANISGNHFGSNSAPTGYLICFFRFVNRGISCLMTYILRTDVMAEPVQYFGITSMVLEQNHLEATAPIISRMTITQLMVRRMS